MSKQTWTTPVQEAADVWVDKRYLDNVFYGVELELERTDGAYFPLSFDHGAWDTVEDGSLRNGIEFVSQPLSYRNLRKAVKDLLENVQACPSLEVSRRCGFHVHVNMSPYTLGQLFSLVTMYCLTEPMVYKTHALGRDDTNFAVPMYANYGMLDLMRKESNRIWRYPAHEPDYRLMHLRSWNKYSALNLHSLFSFGTVEFRQPYATLDLRKIQEWLLFINKLRRLSISFEHPHQVLSYYSSMDYMDFQRQFFSRNVPIENRLKELAEDSAVEAIGEKTRSYSDLSWNKLLEEICVE